MIKAHRITTQAGKRAAVAVFLLVSALCLPLFAPGIVLAGEAATVVFLVRHAEKDKGEDPRLSLAGKDRAAVLAAMLRHSGVQRVFSSDYRRTRDTAAPVAAALGVEIEFYDPRKLDELAAILKTAGGRHLVVGHSNTTPELVTLLGGQAGTEIADPGECDRL